jgi:hypothetical protein
VDRFQGQLKTTCDCPKCGHHNRKFDTFMYVTAPIPGADLVVHEITLVSIGGQERQLLACVKVHKHGNVGSVAHAAAAIAGVPEEEVTARVMVAAWNARLESLTVLNDHSKPLPFMPRCGPPHFAVPVVAFLCLSRQLCCLRQVVTTTTASSTPSCTSPPGSPAPAG